jgi:hypothetical protein
MIIWRGLGIAIPIFAAIVAGVLAIFFDDTRLGNLGYIGWILVITAIPTVLLALFSLGGTERGGWARHTLFFVPVAIWVPLLAGIGIFCLIKHHPASEQARGVWKFERCVSRCSPSLARSLRGMTITIDDEAITVGKKRRAYEVAMEKASHLTLRYKDNGEEERMIMTGENRFVGYITSAKNKRGIPVNFVRVTN